MSQIINNKLFFSKLYKRLSFETKVCFFLIIHTYSRKLETRKEGKEISH